MDGDMSFDDLVDALARIEQLRLVGGRPNFHFKRRAFLHFHHGAAGTYADVKLGADWERLPADTPNDRHALLALVIDHIEEESHRRKRPRR